MNTRVPTQPGNGRRGNDGQQQQQPEIALDPAGIRDQQVDQPEFEQDPGDPAGVERTERRNLGFQHLHEPERDQRNDDENVQNVAGGGQSDEERNPDQILRTDQAEPPGNGLSDTRDIPVGIMPQCLSNVPCPTQACWIRIGPPIRSPQPLTSPTSLLAIFSPNTNSPTPIASREEGKRGLEGTVVAVTGEAVFLDIGYKTEGIIPLAEFQATGDTPSRSATRCRSPSRAAIRRATTSFPGSRWSGRRTGPRWRRRSRKSRAIAGVVTAVVKGGLSVDVGVRAFMPASRSGARDAAEMEKLVGPGDPLPHHQARCGR